MEELFGPGFWAYVSDAEKSGQRRGQAVYNAAATFYPEETSKLNSTTYDPFYSDYMVGAFLERLGDMLTTPPRKKN